MDSLLRSYLVATLIAGACLASEPPKGFRSLGWGSTPPKVLKKIGGTTSDGTSLYTTKPGVKPAAFMGLPVAEEVGPPDAVVKAVAAGLPEENPAAHLCRLTLGVDPLDLNAPASLAHQQHQVRLVQSLPGGNAASGDRLSAEGKAKVQRATSSLNW